MRFLKPLVSIFIALLIGVTSLGFAVSAHTCSESGFAETSLKPLRACCKQSDGKGFQAEPCCKVSIQHVKLPTVRMAVTSIHFPMLLVVPMPTVVNLPMVDFEAHTPQIWVADPPDSPPLATGRAIQTQYCSFLI